MNFEYKANIYALPDGDDGVSPTRSASRDFRRVPSIPDVVGCDPPSTRRAIRAVSSSVATASRRSSSVASGSLMSASLKSVMSALA